MLISDGLPGDFNRDGTVNSADYAVWRKSAGTTGNVAADGNEDNVVDVKDYQLWRSNFGRTNSISSTATAAAVPEPTANVVMLIAAVISCLTRIPRRSPERA